GFSSGSNSQNLLDTHRPMTYYVLVLDAHTRRDMADHTRSLIELRTRIAELLIDVEKATSQARGFTVDLELAIQRMLEQHEVEGSLIQRSYSWIPNPHRPEKPESVGYRPLDVETAKLNLELVGAADRLRGSLMMMHKSVAETQRAGNAAVNNLRMLLKELANPIELATQASEASKRVTLARERERAHNNTVAQWLASNPRPAPSEPKEDMDMAKKVSKKVSKKTTKASGEGGKRASSMTQAEKDAKIKELLSDLANTEDQGEKRKIRARLRTLGHTGGLGQHENGEGKGPKSSKKASKKVSKKSSKKK